MATYNLRRFSHVDGIKGIGEDHLSAVLEPHAKYLAGRNVRLPEKGEDSPLPYPDLVRVLMTPDATTPKGLADALFLIHDTGSSSHPKMNCARKPPGVTWGLGCCPFRYRTGTSDSQDA